MLPFKRSDSVFLRLPYPCNTITRIFLRVKETSQRNTVYLTGRVVGCWDVYRSLFELEDGFPCSHTLARVSRFVGTCYAVVFLYIMLGCSVLVCSVLVTLYVYVVGAHSVLSSHHHHTLYNHPAHFLTDNISIKPAQSSHLFALYFNQFEMTTWITLINSHHRSCPTPVNIDPPQLRTPYIIHTLQHP